MAKGVTFIFLSKGSHWATNHLWYTFSELGGFNPLWNNPLGTLRLAYKKIFWTSKRRRYSWFSKFQEKPLIWPRLGLLLICHIFYIKIWYEWWKGFVGVPNKSPKAKIPNFFNFFNFLRLSPQKSNIGPRFGRDPQMFGFFCAYINFCHICSSAKKLKKNWSLNFFSKHLKNWFSDPKNDVFRQDRTIIWFLWPFLCKKWPKSFLPWISTSNMTQNGQKLGLFWSF